MNSKQKWMTVVGMLVFVAAAVVLSAGGVAADHGPAPNYSGVSSLRRFELYTWALDQSGSDHAATAAASMSSLDRFEAYTFGMEWTPEDSAADSWARFEEYLLRSGVEQ